MKLSFLLYWFKELVYKNIHWKIHINDQPYQVHPPIPIYQYKKIENDKTHNILVLSIKQYKTHHQIQ